jgi:uncharacterized protein (TIGR02001 family)
MEHSKMNSRKLALVTLALLTSSIAQADVTANLGFASDYHYRGIFQAPNSVNGGLDYEKNGFYVGTWAADVKDGLEVDGYFGYGGSVGEFGYSVGYTGYFYTGDFDDTYQEINLGAGIGGFSLDVAVGQYDNFDGPTQDYSFASLTNEANGFYGKYGAFSQDFDGSYFEAGYGTTISEIDLGISLIFSDSDLTGESDEAIVFTIGKAFDL